MNNNVPKFPTLKYKDISEKQIPYMFIDRISFTAPDFSCKSPGTSLWQIDFSKASLYTIGNGFNVGNMLFDAFIKMFPEMREHVRHIICHADYQVMIQGIFVRDFDGPDQATLEQTLLTEIDKIGYKEGIVEDCSIQGKFYTVNRDGSGRDSGYRIQYIPCVDKY